MVTHPGAGGVRPFLQLLEVQALRDAADPELVRRFAATADPAAFRVIAERHGPMVFGVCARLLGNAHDAEDALQATFLVLARRAAAVRRSESLASWLHGVARRVAARLRRGDRRRLAREQAAAAPDAHAPADALAWAEVRAGLDDELGRLPAAYREVLVLCYLEGLTRDEAGLRLGIDPGAVKGRLERGRRLLGERLARRGIGLSAALAGVAVTPPVLAARVGRLAADPAAATPRAAALSHDFLKGVAMAKLKLVTAGLAGALVLAVGVGMGTAQTPRDPGKAAGPTEARKAAVDAPPAARPADDSDEAFIRRLSRDLRGTPPTPAEVHFFLSSKDANKRAVLTDLFVQERNAKKAGEGAARRDDAPRGTGKDLADLLGGKAPPGVGSGKLGAPEARLAEMAKLLDLARAQEEQARAAAERAARDAAFAREHALAEKAAIEARLNERLKEERRVADEAEARAREIARLPVDSPTRVALEAEAARARRDAKLTEKGFRVPADPGAKKGFREGDPFAPPAPAPLDPRAAPPVKVAPPAPPAAPVPPAPVVTGGSRNAAPASPAASPVPAANVEILRVRVQLAEVTLREKTLHFQNTEKLFQNKVVSAQELDLAKIEVERAQLQLREAQLTLDAARPAGAPQPGLPPARP